MILSFATTVPSMKKHFRQLQALNLNDLLYENEQMVINLLQFRTGWKDPGLGIQQYGKIQLYFSPTL